MLRTCLALVLAALAVGCVDPPADEAEPPPEAGGKADAIDEPLPAVRPRRVILFIGDGMGVGSISAASYAAHAPLHLLSMPSVSFLTTHEHEFVTTDSAASATALATGVKTHFEGVGVTPGTTADDEEDPEHQLVTVLDVARAHGRRTGVVTTASIVDATPASFTSHRAKRKSRDEIAVDVRHSEVDVLIGGGRERFIERSDGQNLLDQMRADGYATAKTAAGLRGHSGSKTRVVALLHDDDMPPVATGSRVMALHEMVSEAIAILDTDNPEGYVLVVEGAQIDRRGHELDGAGNVAETLDLDAAVGVALDYARGRDDTLVVVTADHETGGVTVLDAETAEPMMEALGGREAALAQSNFPGGEGPDAFSTVAAPATPAGLDPAPGRAVVVTHGDLSTASRPLFLGASSFYRATHSPVMVPLFAEGPAAGYVARARDNAELGARLIALAQADPAAPGQTEPAPDPTPPRNVVLVVADAVGLPAWTVAHYGVGTQAVETMPVRGLASTHAADRILGDASSAGFAWSTGRSAERGRTQGEALGLLGRVERAGRATAIVSTASAIAVGLRPFVGAGADAAPDLATFEPDGDGLDLLFSGGASAFEPELLAAWRSRGADVELQWDLPASGPGPLVRLVAPGDLDPAAEREEAGQPSLEEMTTVALQHLASREEGFVLVVYAPAVADRAAELDFSPRMLAELSDLDGAVAAARDFAEDHADTLVVVSSTQDGSMSLLDNHYGFHRGHCGAVARCGGALTLVDLALAFGEFVAGPGFEDPELQGEFAELSVMLQGSWLPFRAQAIGGPIEVHSANFVPVFAEGPAAERFGGVHHQSELGAALADLLRR